MQPTGPGSPYTLLFDEDDAPGAGLPASFQALYGNWRLLDPRAERPYTYTNFVASHDGRISFDEPGRSGGGDISRKAAHDTWLMGLLRTRADAILTGAGTLRVAGRHRWLPWETFPADEGALVALRAAEQRQALPMLVVVSGSGELPSAAAALRVPGQAVLVATTAEGAERARPLVASLPDASMHISKGRSVDFAALLRALRVEHGINSLLSEGGARVYGALLQAQLLDEVFLTISPIVVGNRTPPAPPRPTLVEGVAFDPANPPRLRLISLRRHGDYLFQRGRFTQP